MSVTIEGLVEDDAARAVGCERSTTRAWRATATPTYVPPEFARLCRAIFASLIAIAMNAAPARLAVLWTAAFMIFWTTSVVDAQPVSDVSSESSLDIDVGLGYMYDDNVTRAPSGPDKLADQFYSLNASKSFVFPMSTFSRITVDAFVGGELTRTFAGLGNVFGGVQGALQYRGSTEFGAPTFVVFARATGEHFGSTLRSGGRYSAGISARQLVTDRLGVFGALAHNWRYANSEVFDTHDNSALLSVDYSAAPYGTVTLTGEYRRGNIVSTGQKTLAIIDIAQVFVADDVFTSPQMIDYRFAANSVLATLAYNLPISQTSSLEFSWRRVQSTSNESASFPGGGTLQYVDNQFALVLLVRF